MLSEKYLPLIVKNDVTSNTLNNLNDCGPQQKIAAEYSEPFNHLRWSFLRK